MPDDSAHQSTSADEGLSKWTTEQIWLVFASVALFVGCSSLLNDVPDHFVGRSSLSTAATSVLQAGPAHRAEPTCCIDGIDFCRIPAGEFSMGADSGDVPLEFRSCEYPVHTVVLTDELLMAQAEVTVKQFRKFVDATAYLTDAERDGTGCNSLNPTTGQVQRLSETTWRNPGFAQSDNHPVVCVSWKDASSYCAWMSAKHSRVFRLPTEAEWEYACRSGSRSMFHTGATAASLQGSANIRDRAFHQVFPTAESAADWDDGFAFTAPVGSHAPNAFGLHDMHGNAGEWCSDWFDPEYYQSSEKINPAGPMLPRSWHVVRGGSWYNSAPGCRSSGRHDGIETAASTTNGFRVVLEP